MSNNKQIQLALEIATLAHKGAQRRNGDIYMMHVMRVATNKQYVKTKAAQAAAFLHDVVEDTSFTFDQLRTMGVSDDVINILRLLTKDSDLSYEDYIAHLCESENTDAMQVKLSDLHDNLDQSTLTSISDQDYERFAKYKQAQSKILSRILELDFELFKKIS